MKTDDGFCCSINTVDMAENYVVPEDDGSNSSMSSWTNGSSCNYGGGGIAGAQGAPRRTKNKQGPRHHKHSRTALAVAHA